MIAFYLCLIWKPQNLTMLLRNIRIWVKFREKTRATENAQAKANLDTSSTSFFVRSQNTKRQLKFLKWLPSSAPRFNTCKLISEWFCLRNIFKQTVEFRWAILSAALGNFYNMKYDLKCLDFRNGCSCVTKNNSSTWANPAFVQGIQLIDTNEQTISSR